MANENCFYYGGPEKRQRVQGENTPPPTISSLSHNRILEEKRIFLNNSNSKYLALGVVPAYKEVDSDGDDFFFEAYLCGDKSAPLPLGGIEGIASLIFAIRQIPSFTRVLPVNHGITASENIEISTVSFAKNVCIFVFFKM